MYSPGYRECGVRRDREADPQVADPSDGGCMKHFEASFLFAIAGALLTFIGAISVSHPIGAAERPATKATASAAPAASDGALFVEFVSVLRHPRCMNCHSRGDFPRHGDDRHPDTTHVRPGPEVPAVTADKCTTR